MKRKKNIVKLRKKLERIKSVNNWLVDHLGVGQCAVFGLCGGGVIGLIIGIVMVCISGGVAAFFAPLMIGLLSGLIGGVYCLSLLGLLVLNILDTKIAKLYGKISYLEELAKNCDMDNPDEVVLYQKVQEIKDGMSQIEKLKDELKAKQEQAEEEKKLVKRLTAELKKKHKRDEEKKNQDMDEMLTKNGLDDILSDSPLIAD